MVDMGPEKKSTPMSEVMRYFGMKVGEFRDEWAKLTEKDRDELKRGVTDGSLTY